MSMRVRIHRGAHEIGGSCLEVETAGSRIVLDVGRPLSTGPGDATPLPPVAGCSPASTNAFPVSTRQAMPSPRVPCARSLISAAPGSFL